MTESRNMWESEKDYTVTLQEGGLQEQVAGPEEARIIQVSIYNSLLSWNSSVQKSFIGAIPIS